LFKTAEGNVAKFQITGYETVDPTAEVCRSMKIKYDVFPVVPDPATPVPPE
jgi:hypothetical protein